MASSAATPAEREMSLLSNSLRVAVIGNVDSGMPWIDPTTVKITGHIPTTSVYSHEYRSAHAGSAFAYIFHKRSKGDGQISSIFPNI